jgi:hypothetical protein
MAALNLIAEREKLVQVAEPDALHVESWTLDRAQLQLGPGHYPRKPETSDGRGKPFRVLGSRAHEPGAIRAEQLEPSHVPPKRTGMVVILAMDVVRNRTADSYVTGAGHDREEPTRRNYQLQDVSQQHAGLASQHARLAIETDEPVETSRVQQGATHVQTAIAVATSIAERQDRAAGRELGKGVRAIVQSVHRVRRTDYVPPG